MSGESRPADGAKEDLADSLVSVDVLTRKEFRDSIRSKRLWALFAVFIVFFSGPAVVRFLIPVLTGTQIEGNVTRIFILTLFKEITAVFVPLMALAGGYAAITREQESGTLNLLLSLPHARDDVVIGKVLGRSATISLSIIVGVLAGTVVLAAAGEALSQAWQPLLGFVSLTILLAVVFVAVGVAISAVVRTTQQAVSAVIGLFILLNFAWSAIANGLADFLMGPSWLVDRLPGSVADTVFVAEATHHKLALVIKVLNPIQAYKTLVTSLFGTQIAARKEMFGSFVGSLFGIPAPGAEALGDTLETGTIELLLTDGAILILMALWIVVPVAVGALAFRARDL